ncbi:hypothetical protein ES705_34305 [subsurface metagenome]
MARVKKIDNAILKRRTQQVKKEQRRYAFRPQREKILIVTEGERTEPNYFEGFKTIIPRGILHVEVIGTGFNTVQVVQAAQKERYDKRGTDEEYDRVWVAFDKDDFPNRDFNNAVFLSKTDNIRCAYSNESFELWYVLHFQYLDTAINRRQYIEILERILSHPYQKNDPKTFYELQSKGNQLQAINWAKKLSANFDQTNPAQEKPTTAVFKLVKELNKFIST